MYEKIWYLWNQKAIWVDAEVKPGGGITFIQANLMK